jgi:hypothetical protein
MYKLGEKTFEKKKRWDDNIKIMGLKDIDFEDGRWLELARGRVHWWATALSRVVPSGSKVIELLSLRVSLRYIHI